MILLLFMLVVVLAQFLFKIAKGIIIVKFLRSVSKMVANSSYCQINVTYFNILNCFNKLANY